MADWTEATYKCGHTMKELFPLVSEVEARATAEWLKEHFVCPACIQLIPEYSILYSKEKRERPRKLDTPKNVQIADEFKDRG